MTKRMLWFDKNKQFVKAGYRGQCRKGSDKEGDVFLRGNSVGRSSLGAIHLITKTPQISNILRCVPIFSCVAKRFVSFNCPKKQTHQTVYR